MAQKLRPGKAIRFQQLGQQSCLVTVERFSLLSIIVTWALAAVLCGLTSAQPPRVQYLHNSNMPPGFVGQQQLLRGPGMAGYVQPVEVIVPDGVQVSLMVDGQFDKSRPGPVLCGMQIGYVYSIKVMNIPFREGAEVYPTVELLNRLCPPPGQELRFPVPIELTQEEIDLALEGRFVTRVIYLEDPDNALPTQDDPRHQRFTEVGPLEDPLHVADRYGRPMVILRLGSRVPDDDSQSIPGFGSPPIQIFPSPPAKREQRATVRDSENAVERFGKDIPRESLENRTGKP